MKHLLFILFICILLSGCGKKGDGVSWEDCMERFEHQECNGVYYWRTDFRLDSLERDFIRKNEIGRMYVRFFDVVAADNYCLSPSDAEFDILPNATLTFSDTVPGTVRHVVPTVFITLEALRRMDGNEEDAASKIVRRALNMVSYNEVPNVSELQLDCDWTQSTDSIFFRLCRAVRSALNGITDVPFTLSSTIRLHQLRQDAPPVDYGVLMCYNTGSFRHPGTRNSILDYSDVEPYLRRTVDYPLHLDLALPVYDWTLCYRNNEFAGIIRTDSLLNTSLAIPIQDNAALYRATATACIGRAQIMEGDVLRHDKSSFDVIRQVTRLIDVRFSQKPQSVILYHLDSKNIVNFTPDEISQIYSRDSI